MSVQPRRTFLAWLGTASLLPFASACGAAPAAKAKSYPVARTDAQWRKLLTPRQYTILRKEGTERPGTSPLLNEHRKGTFVCAADRNPLFSSATKFESGTGWLAQLLEAAARGHRHHQRPLAVDGAHRGSLFQVRWASWTCVQRWAETDRLALLHERRRDAVRAWGICA